ncbi:chloride channel CLIC-like protein 1 [Silurus meridionalis]|uniref:chloride channel CLIC-like protein 1 n=1 Tax=Silurus meridionalis TaxID=175797 RepID=UPI001EECC98F|nr:chloride channel CLIC-like protein 1 [Silurus meridionalis]
MMKAKCTRGKEIDWMDAFKEWFHIILTCKDDPCKKYYEDLFVNPILLAPPHEALKMTITMLINDPLKHLGECINKFLKVLFLGQTAECHDHPPDHAA